MSLIKNAQFKYRLMAASHFTFTATAAHGFASFAPTFCYPTIGLANCNRNGYCFAAYDRLPLHTHARARLQDLKDFLGSTFHGRQSYSLRPGANIDSRDIPRHGGAVWVRVACVVAADADHHHHHHHGDDASKSRQTCARSDELASAYKANE